MVSQFSLSDAHLIQSGSDRLRKVAQETPYCHGKEMETCLVWPHQGFLA